MDALFWRPSRTDEYPDCRLPPSGSSRPATRRSEAQSGVPGRIVLGKRIVCYYINL